MATLVFGLLQMWATGLIARLLIGGGLTVLVGVALDATITGMLDTASSYIGGSVGTVFDLIMLGGVGTAISIIGGAMVTKAMINTAGRILGVKLNGGTGSV